MRQIATRLAIMALAGSFPLPPIGGAEPTPAPAPNVRFSLPLTDGTTAQAAIIPTTDKAAALIYATPRGELVWYILTGTTPPPPIPPPPPPPVPPPPTPTKLQVGIVEDPEKTTPDQARVLLNREWRDYVTKTQTLVGVIPNAIIDKETNKPPALLVPFLTAAAGKTLPRLIALDLSGRIVLDLSLPETAAAIAAALKPYERSQHAAP